MKTNAQRTLSHSQLSPEPTLYQPLYKVAHHIERLSNIVPDNRITCEIGRQYEFIF
jgi:hypothetical protein